MSYPAGAIPVTGAIGTTDASDTFATHLDYLGYGGLRSVATVAARNAITTDRRSFGMLVVVNADPTPANNGVYQLANVALGGTNNTLTDNANWIVYSTQVENGLQVVSGKTGLGGSMVRNTTITGAFLLSLTQAFLAAGTTSDQIHRFIAYMASNAPVDGTAAILAQTVSIPTADIADKNVYGIAGALDLNLASAKVTGAATFNVAAIMASLILRNSNGANSTAALAALRAGVVLYNAVMATDVRALGIKAPEVNGTGAAITNLYGIFIAAQKIAAITNAYGIYQEGTSDLNVLLGKVLIGSAANTGEQLQVTGAFKVTGAFNVRSATFSTGNISNTIEQTANNTTRINGGPSGENITFGPSNSININANGVNFSGWASMSNLRGITLNTAGGDMLLISAGFSTPLNVVVQNLVRLSTPSTFQGNGATLNLLNLNSNVTALSGTHKLRGIYYNPVLTGEIYMTHIAYENEIGDNLLNTSTGRTEIGQITNRCINAQFQVSSTTKGGIPYPRMTSAQRLAITMNAATDYGLHVYQTDGIEGVYVYKSTGWQFAY